MKYFYIDINGVNGDTQRHIIQPLGDDGFCSFPATDDNPNMVDYLAWVADGNTPEQWQPTQPESEK